MMIHTDANNRVNNNQTVTSKSFEYKIKLRGSNPDDSNILEDLANALEASLSWRLIPSDKKAGLRPISVGEVLRKIVEKVTVSTLRDDIITSVGLL